MKKILLILLNFFFILPCFAISEETLPYKIFGKPKEINFENSFINELNATLKFRGSINFDDYKDNKNLTLPFNADASIESKFFDNKYRFYTNYSFAKNVEDVDSEFMSKFTNLYFDRNIDENRKIRLGTRRAPIGVEGAQGIHYANFIRRGQIARTIGNSVATGVSYIFEDDFFECDLGAYTSTRHSQGFKDGVDFMGRVSIKPFYKKDTPLKNFKLYLGGDIGHKSENYETYFAAFNYEYKKLLLNAEYAYANGYNGRYFSTSDAQGFFATGGWNITPKLQFLVRYDYFDRDMKKAKAERSEYSVGFNYFVFKERLKFAINYVFSDDKQTSRDGHGIYFLTQFFI